jgi:hypothetical protein
LLLFQHFTTSNPQKHLFLQVNNKQSVLVPFLIEKSDKFSNFKLIESLCPIQQQTANQNAAFVGERGKYKIPGLACRPTILPLGLHAGYEFHDHHELSLKQQQILELLVWRQATL